jgi:hypothetical protein
MAAVVAEAFFAAADAVATTMKLEAVGFLLWVC